MRIRRSDAADRAAQNSAAVKYRRIAWRKAKEAEAEDPPPRTLGTMAYCWCGQPMDHDWPGKDDGKGHPR